MTLVVDASAVAELLLGTARGAAVAAAIEDHDLIAPQHLTAEVASVARGWSLSGHLSDIDALRAFREFEELGIEQLPMIDQLPAVWALRHSLTAYDAMYVALARAVGCQLITLDRRMAGVATDCTVVPGDLC